MPIAIAEHHEMLRQSARRWLDTYCPREVPRAVLEADRQSMPPFWEGLSEQGWLGLHIGEEHGGQGGGLVELAVVTEELAPRDGAGSVPHDRPGRGPRRARR